MHQFLKGQQQQNARPPGTMHGCCLGYSAYHARMCTALLSLIVVTLKKGPRGRQGRRRGKAATAKKTLTLLAARSIVGVLAPCFLKTKSFKKEQRCLSSLYDDDRCREMQRVTVAIIKTKNFTAGARCAYSFIIRGASGSIIVAGY